MRSLRWRELSTTDFDELDADEIVVVLPIGSTEQHGPHLPVGTDSLIMESVVDGVIERHKDLPCLFLPTLWLGKSNEHVDFPGTVDLSRDTLSMVLDDISNAVARAGFRRFVVMNSHGGNTGTVNDMMRDIRLDTDMLTFQMELGRVQKATSTVKDSPGSFDIHAGRKETSYILALHPHLLEGRDWKGLGSDKKRGRVAASFSGFKYITPEGRPVGAGWLTTDLTEDGVVGEPELASAEEGRNELDALINGVAEALRETARFEFTE